MKKWLFTFSFVFISSAVAQSICKPHVNDCSYYSCATKKLNCTKDDYFQSFGKKFCDRFVETKPDFNFKGQNFLDNVSNCLRENLEFEINSLSCASAKKRAAEHHIQCYVDTGFCDLDFSDQYRITQQILKPLLFDKVFRNVGLEIFRICSSQK